MEMSAQSIGPAAIARELAWARSSVYRLLGEEGSSSATRERSERRRAAWLSALSSGLLQC